MDYARPVTLDQIVLTQQDEPNQKNCVFRLQKQVEPKEDGHTTTHEKFY